MLRFSHSSLVFAVILGTTMFINPTTVYSKKILQSEPGKGKLKCGQVIYVDDNHCQNGYVRKVVGGCDISKSGKKIKGAKGRKRSCVKK